jgi:hypothetical protein
MGCSCQTFREEPRANLGVARALDRGAQVLPPTGEVLSGPKSTPPPRQKFKGGAEAESWARPIRPRVGGLSHP